MSQPTSLSVVIVVLGGACYLRSCLACLRRQITELQPEIIVPYDDARKDVIQLSVEYPEVKFVPLAGIHTFAELRAAGVGYAKGDIIALTEDHCCPTPDWCSKILEMHDSTHGAVGGVVDKGFESGSADGIINWAIYLCDFVRYANPVVEGPADYLTDCNVSYKRSALDSIAAVWVREFHETLVHWNLKQRKESLWLCSRIVVHQNRNLSFSFALRERFAFGRLFASTRVGAVSVWKRLVYTVFSFLLPAILISRVAMNVFQKRRYISEFFRSFPAILLFVTVWSCGEFWGYLTGRQPMYNKWISSDGV